MPAGARTERLRRCASVQIQTAAMAAREGCGVMRAVVTRVASASVKIDGVTVGEIGKGFLILLGVGPGDGEAQCRRLAEKALGLRV